MKPVLTAIGLRIIMDSESYFIVIIAIVKVITTRSFNWEIKSPSILNLGCSLKFNPRNLHH